MNKSLNILLLEDRYDDAQIIQAELKGANFDFNCITVKSQEDYLEQLNEEIDVILADYSLPNFNALQALKLLKNQLDLDIPFIIVSGAFSDELAVECMKQGATDYLLKDRLTRLGHAVQQAVYEKELRIQAYKLVKSEYEQREFMFALGEISRILLTSLDLDTVMNAILHHVKRVLPHDVSNIMLIEGQAVRFAYFKGYNEEDKLCLNNYHFSLDHPTFKRMLTTGDPRLIIDTAQEADWTIIPELNWIRSTIAAPIQAHNVTIGFLNLDSASTNTFTEIHSEWLSAFAREAAIAIENAQLYGQISTHANELERRVKERTEELLQLKLGVEAILNSTSDAIILLQNAEFIEQANPAFYKLFGYTEEQIIGQSLALCYSSESFEDWRFAMQALHQGKLPIRLDVVARHQNGILFDAEVALALVSEEEDSLVVCSIRDISQRKRTEKELQNTLVQERELRELKSRFIAIVSHEFRNPLSIIHMSASSLEQYQERLDDTQKSRHFSNINSQIDHMTELLEDVLAIETIESGKAKLNLVETDLVYMCSEIIDSFENLTKEPHQIVYTHKGQHLSHVTIDQRLIRQVITNLVSNAVKYTASKDNIFLTLTSDDDRVEIQVKDAGIGIPEQDQENLFLPFNRAHNTGDIPGTGLGLVIAKNAIELHGGSIGFNSMVGVGTTFIVTLPLNFVSGKV